MEQNTENKTAVGNNAITAALKVVKETQWVGSLKFDTIDKCLASMNLNTTNSGWYNPIPIRIKGLQGFFMVNEDGSLHFEQRIIKVEEGEYQIENLSNSGYDCFENKYIELSQL